MDNPPIATILGLISLATILIGCGAAIYAFVLFVKACKRVIRVSDLYLEEKANQTKPE